MFKQNWRSWLGWIVGALFVGIGAGSLLHQTMSVGGGVLLLLVGLAVWGKTIYDDYKEVSRTYDEEHKDEE